MIIYCISLNIINDNNNDNNDNKFTNIAIAKDLSKFNFFKRFYINEFLDFSIDLIIKKNSNISFSIISQSYENYDLKFCCYNSNNINCIIVSDGEYPEKYFRLLSKKIIDDYNNNILNLTKILEDSKNPESIDVLYKVQKDLDETKAILIQSIESILERGEKLDNLVEKSKLLSDTSKVFYTKSRKMNSCCVVQ